MIIDSQINASKVNLGFVLFGSIVIATSVVIYIANYHINMPIYFVFPVAFLIAYIVLHLYQFYYIYFKNDGKHIQLRYMYVHPLMGKRKMIKIPCVHLYKYDIKSSFFGMQRKLILHYRTKDKIVVFPPVSISILTKKEEHNLVLELDKIISNNSNNV